MSQHAYLSASSAHRWINCPPSAKLTADMPDKTSQYAEEGTLAHAFGELQLRKRFTTSLGPKKYKDELKALKDSPLYKPEMDKHIETYVDLIDQLTNAYTTVPYVAVEQRVDFSAYVPEGYGTCDCLIIGGKELHIVDLKYGQGVVVNAESNPQMMLYALGALARYTLLYDIQHVSMTVCQPRLDQICTYSLPAGLLREWGESIRPVAQQALAGEGDFQEGDWCRFCKANGRCRTQMQAFTALEDFGLGEPVLLSSAEISDALTRGKRLAAWLAAVDEYALTACLVGEDIPGWKAVEGRAVRQFTSQDAAFDAAKLAGVDEVMLYERKPITLATLEKVMGKKPFDASISPYVMTPPGKPTLAPANDKRQPITRQTAMDDFKEDTTNG